MVKVFNGSDERKVENRGAVESARPSDLSNFHHIRNINQLPSTAH